MQNLSIYVHYPFCKSKCPYCDFNSHVKKEVGDDQFALAYERELEYFAPKLKNRKIKTIFFGGGTPSLMPINLVERILAKIANIWQVDENCEITLEANPTSFESEKFKDFKGVGVNRLSMGIQALNDKDLKFLGREHSAKEAIETIKSASKIFDNYSFDLIYARPEQTLKNWESELQEAIKLSVNHLSLYQLTIEKGTKFYSLYKNKKFEMPSEDLSADFYELTNEITSKNGLELYEISNYARKGFECKHNLVYWRSEDYLGIGAGAHSRFHAKIDLFDQLFNKTSNDVLLKQSRQKQEFSGTHVPSEVRFRSSDSSFLEFGQKSSIFDESTTLQKDLTNKIKVMNWHDPKKWQDEVLQNGNSIQEIAKIGKDELLEEVVMMGLRLKEGISNDVFLKHFGKKYQDLFSFKNLESLINQGLIICCGEKMVITPKGRILTNSIIEKILIG